MQKILIATAVMTCLTSTNALAHGDGDGHDGTKANTSVRSGTVSGVISDTMCKGDHSAMIKSGHGKDSASCTKACWKSGNKAVLVDKKNSVVYSFSNPKSVDKYAGKTVSVTGHIDDQSKVIHVHSVKVQ